MSRRFVCRTMAMATEDLAAQAQDGDTIVLAWPEANGFNKLALESRAIGLGLDVVIEVAPETMD